MTLLINNVEPYLRILMPDGTFQQFIAGKLEIFPASAGEDGGEDVENPYYAPVMAEAVRRPSISIHENTTTCGECGEVFAGRSAKLELGKHRKNIHFDKWLAEKEGANDLDIAREVKSRAGHACDVCAPVQTFGTAADLAEHVSLLHASAPNLDAAGNTIGGDPDEGRRPGEVARPAAAQPAGG